MGLNWNFQRGGGIQTKKPSVGGVRIFSGTIHNFLFIYLFIYLLVVPIGRSANEYNKREGL